MGSIMTMSVIEMGPFIEFKTQFNLLLQVSMTLHVVIL